MTKGNQLIYSYAEVKGYWKDGKEKFSGYIIKLSYDVERNEDNDIFYYTNGLHQIEQMIKDRENTVEDFVLTSFIPLERI